MEKVCDSCKKLFYFDEYDISDCAGNDERDRYFVDCPHCREENELDPDNKYMNESALNTLD